MVAIFYYDALTHDLLKTISIAMYVLNLCVFKIIKIAFQ